MRGAFLLPIVAVTGCASLASSHNLYVVTAPVEHLRAVPGTSPQAGTHDPAQETQLLYGEQVRLLKTQDAWAYVEAVEQPEFTHANQWQGYPGWLPLFSLQPIHPALEGGVARPQPANAVITRKWATVWTDQRADRRWFQLPMGTRVNVLDMDGPLWAVQLLSGAVGWIASGDVRLLRDLDRLPASARRQAVLMAAQTLLGDPYFWGGRSPFSPSMPTRATGVDCSGLVNLSYRAAGVDIPRDAHEQYLRARRVARLNPADLIFLSDPNQPQRISHVMLYLGDGWVLEGPGTGQAVRRIEAARRLGQPVETLQPGQQVEQRTIAFGAYLP